MENLNLALERREENAKVMTSVVTCLIDAPGAEEDPRVGPRLNQLNSMKDVSVLHLLYKYLTGK